MTSKSGNQYNLPEYAISRSDYDALPEYSHTLPTGTTIGKMWRRIEGFVDPETKETYITEVIGKYERLSVEHPGEIDIGWYDPIVDGHPVNNRGQDFDSMIDQELSQ